MDSDRIGQLQLVEHIEGILCHPVIIPHMQAPAGTVDHLDGADVPVVYADSLLPIVPGIDNVVVIADLHHLVPLPEHTRAELLLGLASVLGIEYLLELPAEFRCTAGPQPGGRYHLDIPHR